MVVCDRYKIREMRKVGMSLGQIASKLRIAKTTVAADCVMKVALFNWEAHPKTRVQ
jgi:hypothetical protein